ncbi:MAG TPA: HEAT repeat domain-containing protein [Bryobacteraceae bacterium]|nr:HEAT repeat domain-containing protein [Bryobacteraceae bacterium]
MNEQGPSVGPDEFAQMIADYPDDPVATQKRLLEIKESDPAAFTKAALMQIGGGENGPGEAYLCRMLAPERAYVDLLADSGQISDHIAMAAAAVLSHSDPEFHRKLLAMRGSSDERRVQRILQIINRDEQAMALVPWLRNLVDGDNVRLASKAAMILCRLTRNPMVVERFLRAEDPRVRANAVEGLWGYAHLSRARILLREAAEDKHHRVAANALVELYRCGETFVRAKIEQLARHPDPLFRAAIAWAIGEIGSPELLPTLELLERDPALSVRLRAGRTAKRLREAAGASDDETAAAAAGGNGDVASPVTEPAPDAGSAT